MRNLLLVFLGLFGSFSLIGQPLPVPYNLDFEIGEKGKLPKGWVVPSYADKLGYVAYLTDEEPKNGKFCLELFREGKYEEGIYGSVMQSIDAKPYRGKMVRFRAYIRAEIHSPHGSAHIWIRERVGNDEESGFFEYLPDQPMVLRQWEVREIKGIISPNADVINFGLLLFGNGKAWIDSALFETLPNVELPKLNIELDQKVVEELVDFSKIYGVVRYFSPLSEPNFDWNCYLYNSVKYVLENRHQPISMKLKSIFNDYLDNGSKEEKSLDSNGYVCWVHYGFPNEKQHPFIYSTKVNLFNPIRKYQGIVQQVVNVQKFAGKEFLYSVYALGELLNYSSKVVLAVRFDDVNNKQLGFLTQEFKKINEKNWSELVLKGKIPDNAFFAKLAIILVGEGNVYFDDAYFGIKDVTSENLLQNEGFENSKDSLLVFNWRLLDVSSQNGYFAFVSNRKFKTGKKSLNIYSERESRISLPPPNEKIKLALSDNTELLIPICMSVSELKQKLFDREKYSNGDCFYDLSDKISQIATLIDVWNFIVHFDNYLKRDVNLDSLLKSLLIKTIAVQNKREYLKIVEQLVSFVKDDFVRVVHKDYSTELSFPFLWKYLDGKIVITKVGFLPETNIEIGDEVIKINGEPITQVIDSVSRFIGYSSEIWKNMKSLAYIRLLSDNDSIELTVKKPDGRIINQKFSKNYPTHNLVEERPERFQFLENNVVYFDLTRLSEKELKDILDTLHFSDYFIFDLRGIVLTSEQFLSLFTDKSISYNTWKLPVFSFPFQRNVSWQGIKCKIEGKSLFNPKGVYLLIDERTVGIGEVIADLAKRNKIGLLVGTKTAGNPMEMASKIFPDGLTFYFGLFKVFDGAGEEIYGKGIVPNIPVITKQTKEDLLDDKILNKVLYLINSN